MSGSAMSPLLMTRPIAVCMLMTDDDVLSRLLVSSPDAPSLLPHRCYPIAATPSLLLRDVAAAADDAPIPIADD